MSVVEEDIFLLFRASTARRVDRTGTRRSACRSARFLNALCSSIALRLIQQPQSFHQQTLGIQLRRFPIRLAFEVEFEISARPAQNPEYRLIAQQIAGWRCVRRVFYLPFNKKARTCLLRC
jgi:hypothetical protein